ncbi:hypothetical protein Ancab_018737 [Ancistrocladus abbreviatus]
MVSSLSTPFTRTSLQISASQKQKCQYIQPQKELLIALCHKNTGKSQGFSTMNLSISSSRPLQPLEVLHKSFLPLAVSSTILFCSIPPAAEAGFLSGFSGIESVPGPQLPSLDFLNRFNEENQKRYAENDARIGSSPIMKELLERSKRNRDKNRQELQDKYCIRGAEWGVGDCSTEGMTPEERESFIAMLKQKAAGN